MMWGWDLNPDDPTLETALLIPIYPHEYIIFKVNGREKYPTDV